MNTSEAFQIYQQVRASRQSHGRMFQAWGQPEAFFGAIDCSAFTREHCIPHKNFRSVADSTIRKELTVLRTAISYANPSASPQWEIPQQAALRPRCLQLAECGSLLDHARESLPHLHSFVAIALSTGQRHSAVCQLTRHNTNHQPSFLRALFCEVLVWGGHEDRTFGQVLPIAMFGIADEVWV